MIYVNTIFTNTVVNVWNSSPTSVTPVISAPSENCFKSRLDNFWKNQDIIYDFRAELYGTRNQSKVVV